MPKFFLRISFVFLLSATILFAEEYDPFADESASLIEQIDGESYLPSDTLEDGPIIPEIQFTNNDISMVFQIISDATGWSIFPTNEVSKAKISLWAKRISAKELLDKAVLLAGFVYHYENDVVKVMTYPEYMEYCGVGKSVIVLKYALADDILNVLKPFLTKHGRLITHKSTNTIILYEVEANSEFISEIIESIDVPNQIMQIEILSLEYADSEIMADTLNEIFSSKQTEAKPIPQISNNRTVKEPMEGDLFLSSENPVEIYAIGRTNRLIIKGFRQDVAAVVELARRLDTYTDSTTQNYHLLYIDAYDVIEGLEKTLGAKNNSFGNNDRSQESRTVTLSLLERSNSIVLSAPPSVHCMMKNILRNIDVPMPYDAGVIRVYKLENADVDEVATTIKDLIESEEEQELLKDKAKFDVGDAPPTNGPVGEHSGFTQETEAKVSINKSINAVIIQATSQQQVEFERLIQKLDQRQQQVLIEAMVVSVITGDGLELGVELNHASNNFLAFTSFGLSEIDPVSGARDIIVAPGGTASVLTPDSVQSIIKAFQNNDNIMIESMPKLLVNDNAIGVLQNLSEEPTKTISQGNNSDQVSFGGYVTAGTEFQVVPHISEEGYLKVEYSISLESFGEQTDPDLPPAKSSNIIQSEATVPDGSTIIVGGIQSKQENESEDKIPILGDLPLVGFAFRNTVMSNRQVTTYLFITPKIMKDTNFNDLKCVSEKTMLEVEEEKKTKKMKRTGQDG